VAGLSHGYRDLLILSDFGGNSDSTFAVLLRKNLRHLKHCVAQNAACGFNAIPSPDVLSSSHVLATLGFGHVVRGLSRSFDKRMIDKRMVDKRMIDKRIGLPMSSNCLHSLFYVLSHECSKTDCVMVHVDRLHAFKF
jgi:hypothetical protein